MAGPEVTRPHKPRDVGNGLVCASFGRAGEWLSLATLDPEVGLVELTGLPLFDPELRGNTEAVLRYRSWMRREEHAFLRIEAGRASVTTREDAPRGTRSVVQRLVLAANRRDRPAGVRLRLTGRLGRPALAQLHETADAAGARDEAASHVRPRQGTLRVTGEGPAVIVQAWLRHGGGAGAASAEGRSDLRLSWRTLRRRMPSATAWIDWPSDAEEVHLDLACTFDLAVPEVPDWLVAPAPSIILKATAPSSRPSGRPGAASGRDDPRPLRVPARLVRAVGSIDQRAATYVRACTALRAGPGERCILADHRILPLSRTRDAYWQARLLLAASQRAGHRDDTSIVEDHLRWLYLRCERPDGRWARSHLADGRRGEAVFAADQQLYPLLELVEYLSVTGSLPRLPSARTWPDLVAEAWAAVERDIDPESGLLRTEQDLDGGSPAHAFLASDQVLLWYVATRLAETAGHLGLSRAALLDMATRTRTAVDLHLTVVGPLGQQWARVDARGGAELAVDAQDLPLALAPLWGFCRPTLPAWGATLRFAFDAANPHATVGPMGGLGSRELPGTWTLGDIVGWVAFGLMGDRAAADAALERLVGASFVDGMLPEAYDPEGSGSIERHWFAWPGAALATLVLEHGARDAG
jgi:hypothetical protein